MGLKKKKLVQVVYCGVDNQGGFLAQLWRSMARTKSSAGAPVALRRPRGAGAAVCHRPCCSPGAAASPRTCTISRKEKKQQKNTIQQPPQKRKHDCCSGQPKREVRARRVAFCFPQIVCIVALAPLANQPR